MFHLEDNLTVWYWLKSADNPFAMGHLLNKKPFKSRQAPPNSSTDLRNAGETAIYYCSSNVVKR